MSDVIRLRHFGLDVAAPDGVIKAQTVDKIDGAEALVKAAEAEAQRIRQEAEAVYAAEKARGLQDGLAEAARDSAQRLIEDTRLLDSRLARIEADLADLVTDAVREIIKRFEAPALVEEVTRTALDEVRSEHRVQLHVARESEETLRDAMQNILADYPEIEVLDIVVDPDITPPNLRLESGLGIVTFSLEDTLEGLRTLLVVGR
jgi:type III secretion protein L